ncbi:hypothetical protein [Jiella avicenniae]|uniref:Phasin protein n=1 Tax=Jiella avicenniae TaxID=2907202 RepID=A0A9X1T6F8_9HYPH|nr:hypothetical protein [Jiella avicenniae]MCE7030177.1 hypothetical protein [Jiella avicenniae]
MRRTPTEALTDAVMQPSELLFLDYQALHVPLRLAELCRQSAARLVTESLGFVVERFVQDQKTFLGLMTCRDFSRAEALQREWLDTAVRQYSELGRAVSRLDGEASDRVAEELADAWTLPAPDEEPAAQMTPDAAPPTAAASQAG